MNCVALMPVPVSSTTVRSASRIAPRARSISSAAAAVALVGSA